MKYLLTIICLIFISCQSSSDQESVKETDSSIANFEKIDSLVVKDILASIFLFQTADKEHFIFRDVATSEVYIYDRLGQLFRKFSKAGDVPGAFSLAAENLDFSPAGNLIFVDPMGGIKEISKTSESLKTIPLKEMQVGLGGAFSLFRKSQAFIHNEKAYFLYHLDINTPIGGTYDSEFLRARKNLILVDLESKEQSLILPFPDQSKFLNGKVFPFGDFRPCFYLDEDLGELYLIFRNEPILYTFDWNGGDPILKNSKKLNLAGFEGNMGWDPGLISIGQISPPDEIPLFSSIRSLEKIDEGFLISYSPMPRSKELISKLKAGIATDDEKARLNAERAAKTVFLSAEGKILEVETPAMHYDSYRVIGNQIYWMKKPDPAVEAEEFVLYWGKLNFN